MSNVFLRIGNAIESHKRYQAALARSVHLDQAKYYARTNDGQLTEHGLIVGMGFYSSPEYDPALYRSSSDPIGIGCCAGDDYYPTQVPNYTPSHRKHSGTRIRRVATDAELNEIEISAAAARLIDHILTDVDRKNYQGDLIPQIEQWFRKHQHELSPCQQRQAEKILARVILAFNTAREMAREA